MRGRGEEGDGVIRTVKIITVFALLITVTLLFSGCDLEDSGNPIEGMFVCVGMDEGIPLWNRIYYDKETKVMYLNVNGGITVLLNADGTPKLYQEE